MGRIFAIVCLFFHLLYAEEENSCEDDYDGTLCGWDDRQYNKPIHEMFAPDSEIIAEYCAEYFEPEEDMQYVGTRLEQFNFVRQLKKFIKLQIDTMPELLHCREKMRNPYMGYMGKSDTKVLYMGTSNDDQTYLHFRYKFFHDSLNNINYIYRNYYDTIYLKPPEYISFSLLCPIPKKSVENHYGKLLPIKKDLSCEPPFNFDPKYTITLFIRITGECPK
jgi:hypothetical protein